MNGRQYQVIGQFEQPESSSEMPVGSGSDPLCIEAFGHSLRDSISEKVLNALLAPFDRLEHLEQFRHAALPDLDLPFLESPPTFD